MNTNWTIDHWINFGLFVATGIVAGMAGAETWNQLPNLITPKSTSTFLLGVLTFLRTMYTNKPRDPMVGERRSDPNPTIPVVETTKLSGGKVVPAVVESPGRPVEDQKPKTEG